METTEKVKYFENELAYILNPTIKEFATKAVSSLPDYFFVVPASSTAKYHPAYAREKGGLALHTRAAIRIAMGLTDLDDYRFTPDELDLAITALLVHDGFKSGLPQETYTRTDHPVFAAKQYQDNENINKLLSPEQFNIFLRLVGRHMGQWNTDYKTGQVLMHKPETSLEKFVALCDYISSRKCLIMDFNELVTRGR